MNYPQNRTPEDLTPEVYDLAAKLYAEKTQDRPPQKLTPEEFILEADKRIPPEFINEAYFQLQTQQMSPAVSAPLYPQKRKSVLTSLAAVLTGAALLAGVGVYLALKSAEKPISPAPVAPVVAKPIAPVAPPARKGKDLSNNNFYKQDLRAMKDLRNADLTNANLAEANLEGVDLSGADLTNANLSKANLRNTNLTGAIFSPANLTYADLRGANLSGTDFTQANLSHANLSSAKNINDAILTDTNVAEAIMPSSSNSN